MWDTNSTPWPSRVPHDFEAPYMFRLDNRPFLLTVCLLLDLIAIIFQGLTCFVFLSQRSGLSHPTTRIMFNQNFAELCVVVCHAINILVPSPIDLPPTAASGVLCRLWLSRYPFWGLCNVALSSLTLSTFERYLAILHPIKHRSFFGIKKAKIGIIFVWINGLVTKSFLVITTRLDPELGICRTSTHNPQEITMIVLCCLWGMALPTILVVFFYSRIFWRLRKTSRQRGVVHGEIFRRAKMNTIITMFIIIINYHLTIVPIYILSFAQLIDFSNQWTQSKFLFDMILVLPVVCVFCNPWIFYFKNQRFRYGLQKIRRSIRMKCCKSRVDVTDGP